ncbi:6-bladed beta-propeller [uncultured Draconibacterium sp.]|uniref:6-bladed beta-propeller n=1 Tax=uncultured Draconibacterium sp. TaxID=1573823 RepID=UPI002AA7D709|nr:6-bladed beta-propeller [uncultured Draconibacterium sp.]
MKNLFFLLLILTLFSCSKEEKSGDRIIIIDPRTFTEKEILLSEIADDISYIPLISEFPIGIIYSYKLTSNYIYAAIKDIGVVRFTRDGKLDKRFGKIGRGPGEYVYCHSFAVDEDKGTVYVQDHKMDDIEVYAEDGTHIRNIKLPEGKDGFGFSDIKYFSSSLFIAQYNNMGRGEYDWIIMDTTGNIMLEKQSSCTPFNGRVGSIGGLFKFNNYLGYWDNIKDTCFCIAPDFSSKPKCLFKLGDFHLPRNEQAYNPASEFIKNMHNYIISESLFETNKFFVYKYSFNNSDYITLINKKNLESTVTEVDRNNTLGIKNDIDDGLTFNPKSYSTFNNSEYLTSLIQPFELKTHVASIAFKNSTPQFPKKKKELEILANSLDENDNPVLMLVKLKQ